MEILFRTKEESNNERRKAFLKLSPAERFLKFLEMMEVMEVFPVNEASKQKRKEKADKNFIINIPANDKGMEGEG